MKELDRTRSLLHLAASSTNEQEARTAALIAAKLIAEHGICLSAKPAEPAATVKFKLSPAASAAAGLGCLLIVNAAFLLWFKMCCALWRAVFG